MRKESSESAGYVRSRLRVCKCWLSAIGPFQALHTHFYGKWCTNDRARETMKCGDVGWSWGAVVKSLGVWQERSLCRFTDLQVLTGTYMGL